MDSYDSQNQLYQQQQQQYQQQLQQQSSQPHDPSQAQSYDYDPSTQAYYPTYPQPYQNPTSESYPQPQQYLQQQQQPYPSYYQPDYAAAAYQQPFQTDPNSAQFPPANVPAPQEPPQIADAFAGGTQPQQNAYYPQEAPPPHLHPQQNVYYPEEAPPPQPQPQPQPQQQPPAYDVPPGLNPAAAAAVAALSQLTQFAGKMEAAERAMAERQWQANNKGFGRMGPPQMHPYPYQHPHAPANFGPPVGRSPYRGGGRRGGARFSGGRSNFGHQRPRPDGGAPAFRGRGLKARGGGRRFAQPAQAVASPHFESEQSQAPDHKRRAPQVAWCDLCRVDCNTQEVLEQHMNGKRHKKNQEKFEKFQKYGKLQSESQPQLEQLENDQGGEDIVFAPENLSDADADADADENLQKESSVENLPSGVVADEKKMEVEQQILIGEQSGLPKVEEPTEAPAGKPWARRFDDRRRGSTWKQMKFGRGGKRARYSDIMSSSEAPKEESKHANEIDFIPQGDNQPSNGQTQELVTEHQAQLDPGLQGQNSTAEPQVSEATMETRDTGGIMVEIKEKGTALENASTGAKTDSIIMEGVSAPDIGVSSTNHVIVPGLDIKLDEGSKTTE